MSLYRIVFILIVSTTLLSCHAGPARQLALAAVRASKIPRAIRAPFRNSEMMTARGFGKRGFSEYPFGQEARQMNHNGKQPEFEFENEKLQKLFGEQSSESIPIEWLVTELSNNPLLAKMIMQRLIVDAHRDGSLSLNELSAASSPLDNNVGNY